MGRQAIKQKKNVKLIATGFSPPQVPWPRTFVPHMQTLEIYVLICLYQIIGVREE
jgi:hypothetical protein